MGKNITLFEMIDREWLPKFQFDSFFSFELWLDEYLNIKNEFEK